MNRILTRALSALALALIAQTSFAGVISAGSQISTGGTLYVIGGDGSVANATGLDFALPGAPNQGTPGPLIGYSGTGALASFLCLPGNDCGTIADLLSSSAFAGQTSFLHSVASAVATGFDFSMDAPLTVTRVPGSETAAAALILSGSGTLMATGFDATNALFTLVTLNNTDGSTTYSATIFSLGTETPMPEPASMALFGLGAAGLLAARRKS